MFPTLSSLLEYVFGWRVSLPLPTFGLFVALAFVFSYLVFLSEFKRKEKKGLIKIFLRKIPKGKISLLLNVLEYSLLGFILGFKAIGVWLEWDAFVRNPLRFIFSLEGSWLAGVIGFALLAILYFWQDKEKHKSDMEIVHPYQLMPKLILWAAIWGFVGAKVFNFLENFRQYIAYGWPDFLIHSGLTFLGGLIFGAISYLYIGYHSGMKLIDLADIGSPGMLVAYGVGRIGCQLSGDGDWGIVNNSPKPFNWLPDWMWSFNFPHNVLGKGKYIEGCSGNYCAVLPQGVFPTSFYETVIILTCFLILWSCRNKIQLPGLMFCFFLLIMGLERFFIEYIKVNFKYNLMGWPLSEAQMVSLCFVVSALFLAIRLTKKAKTSKV